MMKGKILVCLLLACLAAGHVEELSISEPDLEEIFLHYYGKEG